MTLTIGTEIGFDFYLPRVSSRDPEQHRTGRGIVITDDVYSVWPCPGYAVRVTESSDYAAGEVVAITSLSVRSLVLRSREDDATDTVSSDE
jgi:hypothetical protein